jgi:hypothetical protein
MVKTIIKFAIVLLILHAVFRFGTAYLHYEQFKDAVREMALFSKEKDDAVVINRVMELADRYKISLEREFVQVRRDEDHTYVDASYVELIEWVPGYQRPWQFDVGAAAWHVRLPTAGDAGR